MALPTRSCELTRPRIGRRRVFLVPMGARKGMRRSGVRAVTPPMGRLM